MRQQIEHGLQVAVARYLDLCLDPERTWWSAIDHGAGKMSKRSAGMMKARGVKRGLPDFFILIENKPMFGLELKTKGGKMTSQQFELRGVWQRLGVSYEVAHSLFEVQGILLAHGAPMRHKMIMFGGRG